LDRVVGDMRRRAAACRLAAGSGERARAVSIITRITFRRPGRVGDAAAVEGFLRLARAGKTVGAVPARSPDHRTVLSGHPCDRTAQHEHVVGSRFCNGKGNPRDSL